MKVVVNLPRVRRRHNLGRALVFIGLGVLAAGFIYSLINPDASVFVLLIALPGALLAQVGIPLLQKWGSDRRVDHAINAALKGLDDRWTLMHYLPGADHTLFGPPGTLILVPRSEEGKIEYDAQAGEWVQHKPKSGLLRRGGRNELGGLEKKAGDEAGRLQDLLMASAAGEAGDEPRPLLLFMSDDADVDIEPGTAPLPTVHYKKVKDWLRRQSRGERPSDQFLAELADDNKLVPPESEE